MMITRVDQMFRWIPFVLGMLVLLGLTSTANCQQQQTVYQSVGTGISATGVVGANLQNIGQSFHLVSVFARNAPAQTCPALSGTLALQGSFDNSQWLNVRVQQFSGTSGVFGGAFAAQGAYPLLRVNALSGLDSQCVLDVGYSGNVTGSQITSSIPVRGDNFASVSGRITGSGSTITGPVCAANMFAMFYGGYFTNVGAAILTNAAGLQATTNGVSTGLVVSLEKLAVGASLVLPQGPRPYVIGLPNATQTIGYQINAAAGDVIVYNLLFRCE